MALIPLLRVPASADFSQAMIQIDISSSSTVHFTYTYLSNYLQEISDIDLGHKYNSHALHI